MPAYEYQCESCEHHFDLRQKMSDRALETCPECGGHVRRLISGGAGAITRSGAQASAFARPQCGLDTPCCGGGCASDTPACGF